MGQRCSSRSCCDGVPCLAARRSSETHREQPNRKTDRWSGRRYGTAPEHYSNNMSRPPTQHTPHHLRHTSHTPAPRVGALTHPPSIVVMHKRTTRCRARPADEATASFILTFSPSPPTRDARDTDVPLLAERSCKRYHCSRASSLLLCPIAMTMET